MKKQFNTVSLLICGVVIASEERTIQKEIGKEITTASKSPAGRKTRHPTDLWLALYTRVMLLVVILKSNYIFRCNTSAVLETAIFRRKNET